jgi:hypothetical protein
MTTQPTTAQIQAVAARIPTPLELVESAQHEAAALRMQNAALRLANERLRAQVAELERVRDEQAAFIAAGGFA